MSEYSPEGAGRQRDKLVKQRCNGHRVDDHEEQLYSQYEQPEVDGLQDCADV